MMTQTQPWPGFRYVQVPGLANRKIARWLRTQRKNMLRFFYQQGLLDLALRMEQIKKSRQGMMAKNRMFQKVLDDYAQRTSPQPVAQAADHKDEGAAGLVVPGDGVPDTVGDAPDPVRTDGQEPGGSVPEVGGVDDSQPVIEE